MNVPARILVSGASNQIGDFLLPRLHAAGHPVYALSRRPHPASPGATWTRLDLSRLSPATRIPSAEVYIHLAGLPLLPALLRHPASAGVSRVLAFSSTSRLSKQDSPDPRERAVAAQLAEAETAVQTLCAERGIACTLFRPTLVYGNGRDRNISFIAGFVRRWGFFPLLGEGRGLRQPVHADDLALACLQALDCPASHGQVYQLSGGDSLSYADMVRVVFAALGQAPRLLHLPAPLFRGLLSALGWLPGLRQISPSMLERMQQDLCFCHHPARRDFGYAPRGFHPDGLGLGLCLKTGAGNGTC